MEGEGGGQDIDTSELRLVEYVEARAKEINAIDCASRSTSGQNNKTVQSVPNHMRRRAASHNIKRLPRRLRNKALREMKDKPKITKMPSRKHRRRPSNLLQEYNRRKRRIMWLETHIWHAKRFHMQESWGYKVASFPNDKSLRACYRASNNYCMLWDLSYLNCIEISGNEKKISDGFEKITSPNTGMSFSSKPCIGGSIEGSTFLYAINQFPRGAIGPVCFTWKPAISFHKTEDITKRHIWIWTHPSTYEQVLAELKTVFNVNPTPRDANTVINSHMVPTKSTQNIDESKGVEELNCDNTAKDVQNKLKIPDIIVNVFCGPDVNIMPLKDNLCRYRLLGPQSQAVLSDLLHVANVTQDDKEGSENWWNMFFNSTENTTSGNEEIFSPQKLHRSQSVIWDDIKRSQYSVYMPPSTVLGLTVRDPRYLLPQRRHMVEINSINNGTETSLSETSNADCDYPWPCVSYSPLWELNVRKNVKDSMLTEQQLNRKRSENLIPGSDIDFGNEESRVPIMLIHKPGNNVNSTPSDSAAPSQIGIDSSDSGWDIILPTGWGMAFWIGLVYRGARVGGINELKSNQLENGQVYFPDFHPDTLAGQQMINSKKLQMEDVYRKKPPAKRPNYDKIGVRNPFHCNWGELFRNGDLSEMSDVDKGTSEESLHVLRENCNNLSSSSSVLFAVHVKMLLRGICSPFSHICIPTVADCDQLKADNNYAGPIEPRHKRVLKSGLIETNVKDLQVYCKEVKIETSRVIVGYVCQGGFSLKLGQGAGMGYISHGAFVKLKQDQLSESPVVLIRGRSCFQYRFATLTEIKFSALCRL